VGDFMVLSVSGSRWCTDRHIVEDTLSIINDASHISHLHIGDGRGVDSFAKTWAINNEIKFIIHEEHKERLGEFSGSERNIRLVKASESLICFLAPNSKRTLHAFNYAYNQGKLLTHIKIDVTVIRWDLTKEYRWSDYSLLYNEEGYFTIEENSKLKGECYE
jgi:hypothetical protein